MQPQAEHASAAHTDRHKNRLQVSESIKTSIGKRIWDSLVDRTTVGTPSRVNWLSFSATSLLRDTSARGCRSVRHQRLKILLAQGVADVDVVVVELTPE